MRKTKILIVILLLLATTGVARVIKQRQDDVVPRRCAHNVIYAEWRINNSVKTLYNLRVREVAESGEWKEWTINHKLERISLREHTANSTSPGDAWLRKLQADTSQDNFMRSLAFLRSRPNLLREDTMLGLQCFTFDMGSGATTTFSYDLGLTTPLRHVTPSTEVEAIKIY